MDNISSTSKNPFNIKFSEAILNNKEEEQELHKNVRRVLEVIVGLLKDRIEVKRANKKEKVINSSMKGAYSRNLVIYIGTILYRTPVNYYHMFDIATTTVYVLYSKDSQIR